MADSVEEREQVQDTIEVLVREGRTFPPPPEFTAQAIVQDTSVYEEAERDYEGFWLRRAKEFVEWYEEPATSLTWDPPHCTWFADGELNVSYNCLDKQVNAGRGDKVAYHWVSEPVDEADQSERMSSTGCKIVITQDEAWRKGAGIPLKEIADKAVQQAPTVERIVVHRRTGADVAMQEGRDLWWHDLVEGRSTDCEPERCLAEDVLYEGDPAFPRADRHWQIVERYKVRQYYTAPTLIRAFIKAGPEWPRRHDLSSLKLLGTVGEPINPEAWVWYWKYIGGERCPVVDTWWQTENGGILITPLPGVTTLKPGSATVPFPGNKPAILDEHGNPVEQGRGGYIVMTRPWPGMFRTLWEDDERYVANYFSKYGPSIYFAGDGAKQDDDGYYLTGQTPLAFVLLRAGNEPSDELARELREWVGERIGKIARPKAVIFGPDLPKTRSGKIMRRLLKNIADGEVLGDPTTLRDPAVVEQLKHEADRMLGRGGS